MFRPRVFGYIYVYLAVVNLLNVKTDIVSTTHKIRVL